MHHKAERVTRHMVILQTLERCHSVQKLHTMHCILTVPDWAWNVFRCRAILFLYNSK